MRKKILLYLLFCFLSCYGCYGQGITIHGSPKNITKELGGYAMGTYLQVPNTLDIMPWFDSCGILGRRHDSLFTFNCLLHQWIACSGGSSSSAVTSVFGRTGAVVAMTGDYTAAQVGAVPYTGATGDVNLGTHKIISTQVGFPTGTGGGINVLGATDQDLNIGAAGSHNISFYVNAGNAMNISTAGQLTWSTFLGLSTHLYGPADGHFGISSQSGNNINFQISGTTVMSLLGTGGVTWSSLLGSISHLKGPSDQNLGISSRFGKAIDFRINDTTRISVSPSGDFVMYGSSSGNVTIKTQSAVTTYSITLPNAQGAANTVMLNDGSGGLTWAPASTTFSPTTTITGDVVGTGVYTVNVTLVNTGTAGTAGSATQCPVITFDSKGRETAWSNVTITPAFASLTGTPTTIAGYGITDPIVLTSGSYSNPAWITALAWSKITSTPTTLSGYGITDPIVLTSGSYSNPGWITSLGWAKITGTPTTLGGYGITDALTTSSLLAQLNWATGLGAITHLLGPADQPFVIKGGLDATANSSGKDLNLYTQYGTLGGAGSAAAGNINIITGQSGSATFSGGNIVITGNTGTNSGSPGGQVSITSNGKSAAGSGSIGMALLCNTGHLTIGTGASGNVTGNITLFTPTIVGAGSGGNQAGGLIATTGGGQSSGGSGTINGIGGQGGTYNVNIGAGGVAGGSGDATHLTITGGNAGLYSIIFGAGGACSTATGFSGATHTGGSSTIATFTGGGGGAANGSLAGSIHIGGNGTSYLFAGGNGGSATGLLGTNTGGNGGGFSYNTGGGGTGTTANGNSGYYLFKVTGTWVDSMTSAGVYVNPKLFTVNDIVHGSGSGIDMATSGGAAMAGIATLVAGTKTVSTTSVKAGDIIILTGNTPATSASVYYAPSASITAATSFVINAITPGGTSVNASDVSTVNWYIIHTH